MRYNNNKGKVKSNKQIKNNLLFKKKEQSLYFLKEWEIIMSYKI